MAVELDVGALLRSRSYLVLLVVATIIGVPIAAMAYWFLYLIGELQKWIFQPQYLAEALGFHGVPVWWPLPTVGLAGVLVGATIRYLPGRGGHSPADGFKTGGVAPVGALPGIFLAATTGLALGVVLGPEAPLIALGGGVAAGAVRAARRDAPPRTVEAVAAAGSFAAISTLLGSPLAGAFLLMEASGLGTALGVILVPGLLAAGVGSLVFIGFDAWTGHGTFSLAIAHLPAVGRPNAGEFGWAVAIGLAAAIVGALIRWSALQVRPLVESRLLLLTPVAGLAVGGLAVAYTEGTGKPVSDVLFSGQNSLPSLVTQGAGYSAGALVLLVACKGLAYSASLASLRGGPTFPGMFIGAAGGMALSHFPGLPLIDGAAMGIGAMTVAMLDLPLTSVLLTTLFLASDGVDLMPLVIVSVVVAYVARAHLTRPARRTPTLAVRKENRHDNGQGPADRTERRNAAPTE